MVVVCLAVVDIHYSAVGGTVRVHGEQATMMGVFVWERMRIEPFREALLLEEALASVAGFQTGNNNCRGIAMFAVLVPISAGYLGIAMAVAYVDIAVQEGRSWRRLGQRGVDLLVVVVRCSHRILVP